MPITDRKVFLDNTVKLNVPILNSLDRNFIITLNLPLCNYYRFICFMDEMNCSNGTDKIIYLAEAVAEILKTADRSIDYAWVLERIAPKDQIDIVSSIFDAIDKLLDCDYLKIPDLEIKNSVVSAKNSEVKERQKKKDRIKALAKLLDGKRNISLMDEIAIVMTKTNNSYSEIMSMPILVFKDIVRTIIINENRTDDDYNLAYLENECRKYKIELNSEKADKKPAQNKGADLKKLKALLS